MLLLGSIAPRALSLGPRIFHMRGQIRPLAWFFKVCSVIGSADVLSVLLVIFLIMQWKPSKRDTSHTGNVLISQTLAPLSGYFFPKFHGVIQLLPHGKVPLQRACPTFQAAPSAFCFLFPFHNIPVSRLDLILVIFLNAFVTHRGLPLSLDKASKE